ncbi:MAG: hypothetical protein JWM21_900 [Acidobacteria bacterium]|nr:hypothetical protein [Acidobacteriota bacterium]
MSSYYLEVISETSSGSLFTISEFYDACVKSVSIISSLRCANSAVSSLSSTYARTLRHLLSEDSKSLLKAIPAINQRLGSLNLYTLPAKEPLMNES